MAFTLIANAAKGLGLSGGTTDAIDATGADYLVAVATSYGTTTAVVPTDSEGNTWTEIDRQANALYTVVMYACTPTSVSATYTVTLSDTNRYLSLSLMALSAGGVVTVDQSAKASSVTPGSITPTSDNQLIVTGVVDGNAATTRTISESMTTGATYQVASTGGNYMGLGSAYKIQTTAAAINPTWTTSGGSQASLIVSFEGPATGSSSTLTADGGSIAVTGQSIALPIGRSLIANSGSVAVTGQTIGFTLTRYFAGAIGYYLAIGNDVQLSVARSYVLSSEVGSIAINGQLLNITSSRKLLTQTGSVVINGQPAGLSSGLEIDALPGSISVTGSNVTLRRSLTTTADAGTVSITGQVATLSFTQHATIVADGGAISITGKSVGLNLSGQFTLLADAGSIAISGTDVTFDVRRSWSIVSGTGAVTITGVDVDFVLSGHPVLSALGGSVAVNGYDATLGYAAGGPASHVVTCLSGHYTLTGYAVPWTSNGDPSMSIALTYTSLAVMNSQGKPIMRPKIYTGDDVAIVAQLLRDGNSFVIDSGDSVKARLRSGNSALTDEIVCDAATDGADWDTSKVVVLFDSSATASIPLDSLTHRRVSLELQVDNGAKQTFIRHGLYVMSDTIS